MLVDALAPARVAERAHDLLETGRQAVSVAHTPAGVEVQGEVYADGGCWRPQLAWDFAPPALRLRAAGAAAPALPPGTAPLPLLPDARTLRTRCPCGRAQPCVHALVLLLALGACLERQPALLYRDGQAQAGPEDAAVETTRPATPAGEPAPGFWTFAPPQPDDPLPAQADRPPPEPLVARAAPSRPELAAALYASWRRTRDALRQAPPGGRGGAR